MERKGKAKDSSNNFPGQGDQPSGLVGRRGHAATEEGMLTVDGSGSGGLGWWREEIGLVEWKMHIITDLIFKRLTKRNSFIIQPEQRT